MFVPKQEKHTAGNFLMLFSVSESGEYKDVVEEQLFLVMVNFFYIADICLFIQKDTDSTQEDIITSHCLPLHMRLPGKQLKVL